MKIIELELLSGNIAATKAFYNDVLGIVPLTADRESITFLIGRTRLIFHLEENLDPVYHFAFDVPNNHFEEAYEWIRPKTPIIEIEPNEYIADFVNWDAKSFYFHDNNGNIVEVITRYANNVVSKQPFSSESYLAVSEIGLVTNDVPELADTLVSEYGMSMFHRQPRAENFTVIGDDDGLFILVSKGRPWYPVTEKAQSFRTRIVFLRKGVVTQIIR